MSPDGGHTISEDQIRRLAVSVASAPEAARLVSEQLAKNGTPSPSSAVLEDLFIYHAPNDAQILRLKRVREAAKALAYAIDEACPSSADRTAAMRELQSAVMTANRSIVLEGRAYR